MDNLNNMEMQEPNLLNKHETNIEETQERTEALRSMTEEDGTPRNVIKNSNRIIELLKKITVLLKKNARVIGIVGIASLIASVVTVWANWPESKVNLLKEEINHNTKTIEDAFRPNDIIIDSVSSPDVQLIKDFQTSTLRLVNWWKSISTMQPISKYETNDVGMLMNVVNSQLTTINSFDSEMKNVQSDILQILDYGQKNEIPQYIPSADKLTVLYEKAGKRDKVFDDIKSTVMKNLMGVITNITSDNIVKATKPLDKLYNNKDVLDYVNTLFMCSIELNSSYMDYLCQGKNK